MNSLFFWLSKLLWMIFSPDMLLVILLISSCLLLWFRAVSKALVLLTITTVLVCVITIFPVGDYLIAPLENRYDLPTELPESVDGIIVLGGAENAVKSAYWGQPELGEAAERFFAFIQLTAAYPDAIAVFSGGTGSLSRQDLKGADVARSLLKRQGLDISNIIFEADSRNTYENALFTHQKLQPGQKETWILITSASHMPRAVGVFAQVGWQVIPYPVDHLSLPENGLKLTLDFSSNLRIFKYALREWTGLFAYYLTGKTPCFLCFFK